MSISTAEWTAGQANINARQISGDLTEAEAAAELLALTLDWSGLIPANGSFPALGAKVTAFTDLTATRDGDISAWAQGTVDAVITDPVGQPSPGRYPIRIQGGATVWVPSPAAVVSGTQKGDAGANVGQEFTVVAGTSASDPGPGGVKFNHATPASITAIYVDNLNKGGTDVSAWLDSLGEQETAVRAQLTLRQLDSDKVLTFNVTGAVTSGATYRTVPGVVFGAAVGFDVGAKLVIAPGFTPAMLNEAAAATALAIEKGGEANDAAAAANLARDAALYKAVYDTRAELFADLDHKSKVFGYVVNDATEAYIGTYIKIGAEGAGSWTKADSLSGILFQSMPPETGWSSGFGDVNGFLSWVTKLDGTFKPFKIELPDGGVTEGALNAAILSRLLATGLADLFSAGDVNETGMHLAARDANDLISWSVERDGAFFPRKLRLFAGTILREWLATEVQDGLLDAQIGAMFTLVPPESGYTAIFGDPNRNIGLGIRRDGKVQATVTRALEADHAATASRVTGGVSLGAVENADWIVTNFENEDGEAQLRSYRKSDGQVFVLTEAGTDNSAPSLTSDDKVIYRQRVGDLGAWVYQSVAGGEAYPVEPSGWASWGDSMTRGAGSTAGNDFPSRLSVLLGETVDNQGIGGQTSPQIAARQGGAPTLLTVTGNSIPASGAVAVTARTVNLITSQGLQSQLGTLAGVHGTLTRNSGDDTYSFTRTAAGSITACPAATPFVPDIGVSLAGKTVTIWIGRNNTSQTAQILADVAAMIDYLTPRAARFVITSVCNGAGEGNGTTSHTNITAVNAQLEALYGDRFVDVREILIAEGLTRAGITPTSQDVIDIAADIIPASLRSDAVHGTNDFYQIVADLVFERAQAKGWVQ